MTVTWRGRMKYDPQVNLWVRATADDIAADIKTKRFRKGLLMWKRGVKKTIYSPSGRPVAQVHVHDSGNSEHEFDDRQDAVARPEPVRVDWSMAREAMPTIASTTDLPTLRQAVAEMDRVRARLALNPSDPALQAEWRKAKNTFAAAKVQDRILRASKKGI